MPDFVTEYEILRVRLVVLDFFQVIEFGGELLNLALLEHTLSAECGDFIRGFYNGADGVETTTPGTPDKSSFGLGV